MGGTEHLAIEEATPMSLTLLPRYLETQENGEVVLVRFVGSKIHLDARNTDIVQEKLVHFVDELGQRKFVLDFGHVESVSGRTLGVLVQLHTKIQAVGGL